ncbi:hypothetical protein MNBD_GAMMA11-1743 [hydrothermal vent metagenome]|uniref:Tetratricopeptide repeat protein n=1 Tax=hydrothermal vent metagenome TaxID=652676 RepID=A0A3B0X7C2_9ZZZZ
MLHIASPTKYPLRILFNSARLLIIICACLAVYSCALKRPTPESINDDINLWLEKKQFIRIDNAFDTIDASNPHYSAILKRRPYIENIKKTYIKSISAKANRLKNKGQWQQAINVYAHALANLKDKTPLIGEHAQLVNERNDKINGLRKELLIKRAKSLASYQKIYLQLNQLIPDDNSAQYDIHRYEKDKLYVSSHLEKCGELANVNRQFDVAIECFSLSYELMPNKHKLDHIKTLEATLGKIKLQKRDTELLAAYKTAYSKKRFIEAKKHLNMLLKTSPEHKKAKLLLKKLNTELEIKLQDMLASGKYLYSQNKINEALVIWKKAQKIAPGNKELTQLIYRTEKVSKKIKSLEHNQ